MLQVIESLVAKEEGMLEKRKKYSQHMEQEILEGRLFINKIVEDEVKKL